MLVLAINTNTV